MKIVILDGYSVNPGDLSWDAFKDFAEVEVYDRTPAAEVTVRAAEAEIILTNKVPLDAEAMNSLPKLRYIGVLATGYNVVDIEAARSKGIVVTNIPAYSTRSVAQMVFAHILNITQRVGHYADEVRNGAWSSRADFCYWNTPLMELEGKKIGLVGFGHTGQATARIALSFGMEVYVYTSKSAAELPDGVNKISDMDALFRLCDFVSLHCPLTADTAKLVNAERLALMSENAILINTGRGGLVDEQALAEALQSGRLAGAGLDVLSEEPPRSNNPLLSAKNCYITPHIAWATREARVRLMKQAVANVKAFLEGKPINNVI